MAVKALRYCTNNEDISRKTNKVSRNMLGPTICNSSWRSFQRLRREIRLWQRLKHENILPLYGTTSGFGLNKSMVCLWAENGCLNEYLRRRGCNLNLIDRFRIVSRALTFGDFLTLTLICFVNSYATLLLACLTVCKIKFPKCSLYSRSWQFTRIP